MLLGLFYIVTNNNALLLLNRNTHYLLSKHQEDFKIIDIILNTTAKYVFDFFLNIFKSSPIILGQNLIFPMKTFSFKPNEIIFSNIFTNKKRHFTVKFFYLSVSKFLITILESLFWKFHRIKNLSLTLKEV
jgi:hypothetical protein